MTNGTQLVTARPCPRVGCVGAIDGDGFCDACGLEAPGPADGGAEYSARTDSVSTWSSPSVTTSGSGSSRRRTSGRGMLGAGLVDVPPVPYRDPTDVLVADPQVPEKQRYCAHCGSEVGRRRDGRPARTEGFCPRCGHGYSFTPKLLPGQVVHDQYEVLGCIAHGGLGWIYLASDHAVSDRWVVLKGVIDSSDADATAAAIAERHFLAKVEHPNIVKIHNFVQHSDPVSGSSIGYIVMEYVGGQSLKDMLKQLRREHGPAMSLPPEQALAYTIEALRPLDYLHSEGLLYCDIKPDNLVQTQEQLKLIDLGAVRHRDDRSGAVYGTVGYQAPEVKQQGPSAASDLYAMGRTLAVLITPFAFTSTYANRLPPPTEAQVLAEHESLHRALQRACHPDPGRRFASAEEMSEQLTGVLREVLAAGDGQQRPAVSGHFGPEVRGFGIGVDAYGEMVPITGPDAAAALPVPRVDSSDPAAELLTTIAAASPAELIDSLQGVPATTEVWLRLTRARIELGDYQQAERVAAEPADDPSWRAHWARGLAALGTGELEQARLAFDSVFGTLPGELAPKLALAACAELIGDLADAERYYRITWRTDRSSFSAAFGLARVLHARGERTEAVAVLGSVPATSAQYVAAQTAAVRVGTSVSDVAALTVEDLTEAGERAAALDIDEARKARLEADVLESGLAWVQAGGGRGEISALLDCAIGEESLRLGLERRYRTLASHASTVSERYALVDRANHVRPWTRV